ncbi:efflux RND transporter periplasmic adaptor subunit [Pseudooceanicola spongiae]|uniref:Efflux RND transporter periplasmic adaptor subunit n=1 Tax=Pseudooceanicola spongiae TaxID=2613965 RepID=A0A7L9WKE6_9RHOB|nr:efflux RND transporter periplasmic adaptor subunit [Pseudooceanicola spongiae]QOL80373.1 efflux RND transporter periplasmic adaptor subunit [Pseudooceanicola spongiae]
MTRKQKLLIAGVAAVAVIGALVFMRPKDEDTTDVGTAEVKQSAAALTVSVQAPQKDVWPLEVEASGWLAAWQEVVISAQVGGQMIVSVNADVGDTVAENDILSELSSGSLENEVLQLDAALESARASLDQATAEADRARQLSQGSSISQQQAAEYIATERKAKADVSSAEAKLASAQLDLSYTKVKAVTGGVISERSAAIGDVASAGAELFRLIRDGRVEWQAEVPLIQLRNIEVGTPVSIPTPVGEISGVVRRIAPTASESNGRVIVYVSLTAPEGPGQPKTGIMISGVFKVGEREALSVPASAVVMQDGFSYVFTLVEGETNTVSRVRVDTGRRQDDRVEITSELPEDAQVVQSGGAFLSDGSVVRVVSGDEVSEDADKQGASAKDDAKLEDGK